MNSCYRFFWLLDLRCRFGIWLLESWCEYFWCNKFLDQVVWFGLSCLWTLNFENRRCWHEVVFFIGYLLLFFWFKLSCGNRICFYRLVPFDATLVRFSVSGIAFVGQVCYLVLDGIELLFARLMLCRNRFASDALRGLTITTTRFLENFNFAMYRKGGLLTFFRRRTRLSRNGCVHNKIDQSIFKFFMSFF